MQLSAIGLWCIQLHSHPNVEMQIQAKEVLTIKNHREDPFNPAPINLWHHYTSVLLECMPILLASPCLPSPHSAASEKTQTIPFLMDNSSPQELDISHAASLLLISSLAAHVHTLWKRLLLLLSSLQFLNNGFTIRGIPYQHNSQVPNASPQDLRSLSCSSLVAPLNHSPASVSLSRRWITAQPSSRATPPTRLQPGQ